MLRMSLLLMELSSIALHLWMKYGWMSLRGEIAETDFVVRGRSRKRGSELNAFIFLLLLQQTAQLAVMIITMDWYHLSWLYQTLMMMTPMMNPSLHHIKREKSRQQVEIKGAKSIQLMET
jgi:hypothetical protein